MYRDEHCCTSWAFRVAKESKSGGFRLDLGEPWSGKLADFCAAHYNASQTEIVRRALDAFIDQRLADPGESAMKARFEEERRKRLAGS
jgi:hypothetical protein